MTIHRGRLRAAFLLVALGIAASPSLHLVTIAAAQGKSVEVPAYRALGAGEAMTSPGQNGADYSASAPSLAGLTLLATIPAPSTPRLRYFVEAQGPGGGAGGLDEHASGR